MTSGDIKAFLAGLGEIDFIGFGIKDAHLYVGCDWKREAKEKDPNRNVVRTFRPVVNGGDTGLRILVITDPADRAICALGIGNKVNAIKTALLKNPASPPSVKISMPSVMASTVNGIRCACNSCGKDDGLFLTVSDEDGDEDGIDVWPNYKGMGVCVDYNDGNDPHLITPNDIDNIKALKPKWRYPDCLWSCMCVEDESSATVTRADGTVDDDEDNGGRYAAKIVGAKKPLLPLEDFLYHHTPPRPGWNEPLGSVVVTPRKLWEDEHHVCDQSEADGPISDDPELDAVLSRLTESEYEWPAGHTWAEVEALLVAKGAEEITDWDFDN